LELETKTFFGKVNKANYLENVDGFEFETLLKSVVAVVQSN